MAVVVTIGGVTRYYRVGTLKITGAAKERTTASFSIRSNDASYRPALGDEVLITENGTRIFGGTVDRPSEQGVLADDTGAYVAITTSVSAADFNQYAERRVIDDGGFPAGWTLEQTLNGLALDGVGGLISWFLDPTDFGVTIDPAQVTGPTLPEMVYKYMTLTEVFNELATLTGKYGDPFVWEIDAFKVLRMYQPSTEAAPFDITEGDGNVIGDLTVESSRDKYANRIYLKVPSKSETARVETFTGDGVTTTFTPTYTITKTYGTVGVTSNPNETLNFTGDADPAAWTYDAGTNSITRTLGAPGVGEVVTFKFDGVFNGSAMAQDAAAITADGIWERVVSRDDVPDGTTAQALADAALAEALTIPQTIKYKTFQTGIKPGQTQHITFPMRDLDVDAIVTDVSISDYGRGGARLLRSVTLTTGAAIKENWRGGIRKAFSDKSGGGSSAGATAGAGTPTKAGVARGGYRVYFTTPGSHTYTPTTGTQSIEIELLGAGGGGAGVASAGVNQINLGSGGGGGGYLRKRLTTDFSGATIVVGTAGSGGASGDNNGTNGTATTFTDTSGTPTVYTAGGGDGGAPRGSFAGPITCAGSLGGTSTNGDINVVGASAAPGLASNQFVGWAGGGGGSPLGSYTDAALVVNATSTAGPSANGNGAGGSGAVSSNAGGSKAGGNGSHGIAIIWEYQ